MEKRILIIDDEEEHLRSLERIFQKEGFDVATASRGKDAIDKLRDNPPPVILTDLIMPGETDGLDILKTVKSLSLDSQVILMTAYGTVETAVQAMKSGAYDFITKPIRKLQVVKTVDRALEKMTLIEENRLLRARLEQVGATSEIIGSSTALQRPLTLLQQAAPSTATILVQGESGTGKELFARGVHRLSGRQGAFVAVNCAALPESILESELFGHERGAFTGAFQRKEGRIMAAHQGTLFLDEIGDMSLTLQAKLLRVLQEGEFERVGGAAPVKVDFRLVAATNHDLEADVEAKRFRQDLYYRLNTITIQLPPLRDRRDDVLLLTQHFVRLYCEKNHKPLKGIAHKAMEMLENHAWPGNVRQLEKTIERAVVLSTQEVLQPTDFFEEAPAAEPDAGYIIPFGLSLEEIERRIIRETLRRTAGDKKLAAQVLGIASRTIYRKLDQDSDI
ncbi:MAG: sigma-54-dependent Fis family transcriptional regulator [Myxococcales bacterium]|nr:MAG: sigma-54-dependent Fis family transcriptional regulator [Myxococcales bacterium]